MDETFQDIQPEVESWYGAELRHLRSANEQIAFYAADNSLLHDPSTIQNSWKLDGNNAGRHDRGLLLPKQIHTSLDPFVALPGGVSEYQRMRIQFYTQTLGAGIFGVTDTPRYSPTAATGISTAIYSEVGRAWICILVDETLNVLRGGTAENQELSRQRARGYHELNKALRSRDDHYQEALMALTVCGLTEFRFGDSHSRDMHTTATDMFLRSKGNLEAALAAAPNIEPFYVSGQFGFGRCHFPSAERLQATIDSWKSNMFDILASPRPAWDTTHPTSSIATPLRRDYRLREARVARLAIGATDTVAPPTIFASAMQLSLFIELSWTLLQCGTNHELAVNFLKRVEYLAKGSFIGGGSGERVFELRAAALAALVSRARRDVIGNYLPGQLLASDTSVTSVHINALKMFQYLDPEARTFLINKLARWLSQKDAIGSQLSVLHTEFSALEAQIIDTWSKINST